MTKKMKKHDKKMTTKNEMTKKMTTKTTKNDKLIILIFQPLPA